jgi:hypothetical protein
MLVSLAVGKGGDKLTFFKIESSKVENGKKRNSTLETSVYSPPNTSTQNSPNLAIFSQTQ